MEKARADEIFARRGLDIERNEARSRQSAAEVALALAKLELAKWQKGDVPKIRRELDLALQKAQRLVERTKRDYEISVELHAQKFISDNDLEDSEIAELPTGLLEPPSWTSRSITNTSSRPSGNRSSPTSIRPSPTSNARSPKTKARSPGSRPTCPARNRRC